MIRTLVPRLFALLFVAALSVLASQWVGAKGPSVPRGAVRVSKVFGWQPMKDGRLILWLGVSEPWMLTLAAPCDLPAREPLWVSLHDGHIVPGTDAIGNGEQSCRIQRITQIPAVERTALGLNAPVGGPLVLHRHYSKRTP
ncbi:DUF6491 family protein [Uliginosibacterium sp. sgz301328]|uniref:DUF6491 family protein n=1 Tax=Uliginosibacterium sp. sgz301328 TaxID=3243764 RepID=UPI00359DD2CB